MAYEIRWSGRAEKDILGLQPKDQRRVAEAIGTLALNPRPVNSKKLEPKSAGEYSLRVSFHLRVIYRIHDDERMVFVIRLGQREGAY